MTIQASFAKKMTRSHECNHRLFALLGKDGQLDLAFLNVKNCARKFSLQEDNFIRPVPCNGLSFSCLKEKFFGIKYGFGSLPQLGSFPKSE
jgi:hypothetical protein